MCIDLRSSFESAVWLILVKLLKHLWYNEQTETTAVMFNLSETFMIYNYTIP